MKKRLAVICLLLSVVGACRRDPSSGHTEAPSAYAAVSLLDSSGTQHLVGMLHTYYELKEALTVDDAAAADRYARQLMADIGAFPLPDTPDVSLSAAGMAALLTATDSALRVMAAVKDASCEPQRIAFRQVSDNLLLLIQAAGLRYVTIYRQYCPMAFNDRGAHWLSESPEIKNPYFGKKMAECGEVSDTLY